MWGLDPGGLGLNISNYFQEKKREFLICRDFSNIKVQVVLLCDDATQPSIYHDFSHTNSQPENLNCKMKNAKCLLTYRDSSNSKQEHCGGISKKEVTQCTEKNTSKQGIPSSYYITPAALSQSRKKRSAFYNTKVCAEINQYFYIKLRQDIKEQSMKA